MSVFCANLWGLQFNSVVFRFNSVVASQTHLYKSNFLRHTHRSDAFSQHDDASGYSFRSDTTAQRRSVVAAFDCWLATRAAKNLSP